MKSPQPLPTPIRAAASVRGLLVVLCALSGCFRYVAPTSELQAKSNKSEPGKQYLGAELFKAQEQEIGDRLKALVQERRGYASASGDDAYRLGARDVVDMSVFGLPELSGQMEVSPMGTLRVPVLQEELPVGGLTVFEARDLIAQKLRRYVRAPQVTLALKSYESQRVAVTGAVAKPGMYPLRRRAASLAEMIAEAGGRNEKAGNRVVLVPGRSSADTSESAAVAGVELDYEDLIGTGGQPPLSLAVLGGDTIIIPEAGTYEVDGEVDMPGSRKITGRTSVLSAIAAAGGFTYAAKVDEVEVFRDVGGGKKALMVLNLESTGPEALQDIRVRDGDLIRVPTSSGRHMQRQIVEGLNSIFRGVGVQGRMN